jgi:hypothetical protein
MINFKMFSLPQKETLLSLAIIPTPPHPSSPEALGNHESAFNLCSGHFI